MADMPSDPLPESVYVTVFMEGRLTGVARTEVFRVHPSSFEEAVSIAQNAEHDFKSSRLGWNGYNPNFARTTSAITSAYCKLEPMDLSNAEDEGEAELNVAEQRQEVRRCYLCESTKLLRPTCTLRKQRPTPMGRNPSFNQKPGMARGTSTPSRRGVPYWGRTEFYYFSTR